MISLLAAFQFLTIFPNITRLNRIFTPDEMGRAAGFFPLVGLVLGGILLGLDSALRLFIQPQLAAVLVVAAWLMLTRALHFDGFLDIFDGLFGGFTPERRLEIMKDSRVGIFNRSIDQSPGGFFAGTRVGALDHDNCHFCLSVCP
ncbi:MAG: adenosylcobinamide-GDP ribazoletransferase [Chloroflexi bacterium]|nr:adenosylcobinamide-GDP ribazoletransferase [Chloroflexota bacterium]